MTAKTLVSGVRISVFPSELGWMAVVETQRGVSCLTLAHESPAAALAAAGVTGLNAVGAAADEIDSTGPLVKRLQAFAKGRFDDFRDVPLDLGRQTDFQRRVIMACRAIGPGQTCSYGELAEKAGASRAARAVGSVMAANRIALLVPCHRVLGAGGKLGGYSMRPGLPLKRALLDLESRFERPKTPGKKRAKRVAAASCDAIG